jgi:hypothetical protein
MEREDTFTDTTGELAARFNQVMHTLRHIVAQVEEGECVETTLARSPRGALEGPHTTDDLASLMQGLMGSPLAPTPSPGPASTSPIIPDTQDTSHALLYDRTIELGSGGGKLWAS